jgi:CelD/BcsL family acetyltransferase involved in cellulose biosynthesis
VHSFANPFFEPFAQALIRRCHDAGVVEMLRAAAGQMVLGYLLNFRYRDRVYAYQSGFDDADRSLRPGVVTHYLAIERGRALGAATYDFMAGYNRLKESFVASPGTMIWYTLQQPRFLFRLENWMRRLKTTLAVGRAGRRFN